MQCSDGDGRLLVVSQVQVLPRGTALVKLLAAKLTLKLGRTVLLPARGKHDLVFEHQMLSQRPLVVKGVGAECAFALLARGHRLVDERPYFFFRALYRSDVVDREHVVAQGASTGQDVLANVALFRVEKMRHGVRLFLRESHASGGAGIT